MVDEGTSPQGETWSQGNEAEGDRQRSLTAGMVRLQQSSKRENFNMEVCCIP